MFSGRCGIKAGKEEANMQGTPALEVGRAHTPNSVNPIACASTDCTGITLLILVRTTSFLFPTVQAAGAARGPDLLEFSVSECGRCLSPTTMGIAESLKDVFMKQLKITSSSYFLIFTITFQISIFLWI